MHLLLKKGLKITSVREQQMYFFSSWNITSWSKQNFLWYGSYVTPTRCISCNARCVGESLKLKLDYKRASNKLKEYLKGNNKQNHYVINIYMKMQWTCIYIRLSAILSFLNTVWNHGSCIIPHSKSKQQWISYPWHLCNHSSKNKGASAIKK